MSVTLLWSLAQARHGEGLYEQSLALCHQIIDLDPRFVPASYLLANCVFLLERWQEAEIHLRRCLDLPLPKEIIQRALVTCWRKQGLFDEAERALGQMSDNLDNRVELARVYRDSCRLSKALGLLDGDDHPEALAERALIYQELERADLARELWRRCLNSEDSELREAARKNSQLACAGTRERAAVLRGSLVLGWSYDEGLRIPDYPFLNANVELVGECLSRFLEIARIYGWPIVAVAAMEPIAQPIAIALSRLLQVPVGPLEDPALGLQLAVWLESPLHQGELPEGDWLTFALGVPGEDCFFPDVCAAFCPISVSWQPASAWWAGATWKPGRGLVVQEVPEKVEVDVEQVAQELVDSIFDSVEAHQIADFCMDLPLRPVVRPRWGAEDRLRPATAQQAWLRLQQGDPNWCLELGLFQERTVEMALQAWFSYPRSRRRLAILLERCPGRPLEALWALNVGREHLVYCGMWLAALRSDDHSLRIQALRSPGLQVSKLSLHDLAGLEDLASCVAPYAQCLGPDCAEWLSQKLQSQDKEMVYAVLEVLPKLLQRHPQLAKDRRSACLVQQLRGCLDSTEAEIVRGAAMILSRLSGLSWLGHLEWLEPLLDDEDPERRGVGAEVLVDTSRLTRALAVEQNVRVQRALVVRLTQLRHRGQGKLVRGLLGQKESLDLACFDYLAMDGLEAADVGFLLAALLKKRTCAHAAYLLWRLGRQDYGQALMDLVACKNRQVVGLLLQGGVGSTKLLLAALEVRPEAVELLVDNWRKKFRLRMREACRQLPESARAVRRALRGQARHDSRAWRVWRAVKI